MDLSLQPVIAGPISQQLGSEMQTHQRQRGKLLSSEGNGQRGWKFWCLSAGEVIVAFGDVQCRSDPVWNPGLAGLPVSKLLPKSE